MKFPNTHTLALMIQSRSSSPSSLPPGPPCTRRNSCACQSTPSFILLAASSRCISSIRALSSVAVSWSFRFTASVTTFQSRCDSRSSCSSNGRVFGGVCFARVASKRSCFLPVYNEVSGAVKLESASRHGQTYRQILDPHLLVPQPREFV